MQHPAMAVIIHQAGNGNAVGIDHDRN